MLVRSLLRGTERRDVQFSPSLSVMLSALGRIGAASGVAVNPETAMRMMAVRACVRVISEDIASLPLITYRRLSRGKERALDHPLYRLLHDRPNPEMTSFQFRETLTAWALTWGNAFAEVVPDQNGFAGALWPMPPSSIWVRRNPASGQLEYFVQPPGGGAQVPIPASRMFHLRALSTDGVMGRNPIADARDAIGLGMAAEQFASGFFINGARPSMVVEHPGSLTQAAYDRLRNDLDQNLTTLTNAQRVAILEEGMKAHTLTVSPEDAQFIDQRKFSVLEMARLYRVQPHKIGVTDGTQSYASVEQANIDHVISTIRPWAVRWEQQIGASLIPAEDDSIFVEHLTDGLLRGDTMTRFQAYQLARQNGWMSADDIREAENMNPIEGGDIYWRPSNMVPADTPVTPPTAPTAPAARSTNGHRKEYSYGAA